MLDLHPRCVPNFQPHYMQQSHLLPLSLLMMSMYGMSLSAISASGNLSIEPIMREYSARFSCIHRLYSC